MGYKTLSLKLPTNYSNDLLRNKISKELRLKNFEFEIEGKSLDARKKKNIHWLVRVLVNSPEIKGEEHRVADQLEIPYKKRTKKVEKKSKSSRTKSKIAPK